MTRTSRPSTSSRALARRTRRPSTVYYTVVDHAPPDGAEGMRRGWAAWWSGDPRRDRDLAPDMSGSARTARAVPIVVAKLVSVTFGPGTPMVEVDILVAWAPASP